MKVIVIGAGIVGAAVADQLALNGADVTVLEQSAPGSGASGKSFGWINASFAETDAYFALRRSAIDAFRQLGEELSLAHTLDWSGCLWWEDQGDAFELQVRELERRGYEAEVIDGAQFARLEPAVANPPDRAIHCPIEGAADGDQVAVALLERAARNRADLICGRAVTGLRRRAGRVVGVETGLGALTADLVICATGAWTESFLKGSGLHLPMDNKPGLILHTAPVARQVRHIIMSPDIHFRQTPDGSIVMGEIFSGGFGEAAQGDALSHASALADDLLSRLARRLPAAATAIQRNSIMLGTRPVPADGLPAIGPVPGTSGLYLATMHSGVTLAPLVGSLVADEILQDRISPLLQDFRPDRFA